MVAVRMLRRLMDRLRHPLRYEVEVPPEQALGDGRLAEFQLTDIGPKLYLAIRERTVGLFPNKLPLRPSPHVAEWLAANMEGRFAVMPWDSNRERREAASEEGRTQGVAFRFSKPEDAALFRLFWC